MYKGTFLVLALGAVFPHITHANVRSENVIDAGATCDDQSIVDAVRCGQITGKFHTLYYSTHNAYFVEDLNQDTVTTGGYLKFETAPFYGVKAGVSYSGQRRLDDRHSGNDEVTELKNNKDGLAEAYLDWKKDAWKIKIGQQHLDVPFLGNYDWRIMPPLFRAIDIQYGSQNSYVRFTGVDRFKSYADDQFTKTSRYSNVETDGMWSVGLAKSFDVGTNKLNTQAWYQNYDDYSYLAYLEGHLKLNEQRFTPSVGLQAMYAKGDGQALKEASTQEENHKVDHQGIGALVSLNPNENITIKAAYNYIKENKDSYMNGALFTPYMIYTSSGPYFAQSFFTSTQDLGSGHAYMVSIEGALNEQTYIGANYSFMDLKESANVKSLNQSEYVIYGFYDFKGAMKGWSLANFFGVITSPREDKIFLQNRFGIKYVF
jgi:hypothetical protein